MNDYELPSFDDDEAIDTAAYVLEHTGSVSPPSPEARKREPVAKAAQKIPESIPVQFDTSTSVHTIPDRMTAVPIKCRCGGKLGYRDPNTPRIWCGGCGRNL